MRLVNGSDRCSGRVEILHDGQWGTVCDDEWDIRDAQVVCRVLDCGTALTAKSGGFFGQGHGDIWMDDVNCVGNETSLEHCQHPSFGENNCGHGEDAGVICSGSLEARLVNGKDECSGRVEVQHGEMWRTVCDTDWTLSKAQSVCELLECGQAVNALVNASFGQGSGSGVAATDLCFKNMTTLQQCSIKGFSPGTCGHEHDAGITCAGALQKPQISLSPGPEVNWGEKVEITCTIVTEHSGGTFVLKRTQDSFKMERFSEHEAATFGFTAQFDHKGSYFCEYQKKLANQIIYYPQGNVAELSVTVKLEKPRISLTSPHAMVIYSPDRISVNQGNGFSISCSTYSTYAGGVFYLKMSSTNTSEVQSAFGHMLYVANFDIPAVEYKHQGDYTCVYGVNVSSRSFCSVPSNSLKVTVVGTMVKFTNRFGGAIKHADAEERTNGAFDGRDRKTQSNQYAERSTPGNKSADAVLDNSVERIPEDLAGRIKKDQEDIMSILKSKKIAFKAVDISQNPQDRDLMRKIAGNPAALPPQICKGDVYCGLYKSPIHRNSTMAEEGIAAGGVMDVNTALPEVLKTALIHDGLARGIREAAKALDKRQAHLCVLAANCDEPMYVKLVEALCAEHQINLIKVDDNKKLGEWVGLCKIDREGKPRKVVGCSCVVVKLILAHGYETAYEKGRVNKKMDYGKESQAKDVIEEYFKAKK
ncbi:40S ribosomal protein S12 [Channa argus]|uniref:40S ribosomal protein S12 n=1 Tax=Channa argus TaxID=215402 RepID=A0A6G1QJR0_CHAAH|nr:40S ribosomal protein S12 [Channa argus]